MSKERAAETPSRRKREEEGVRKSLLLFDARAKLPAMRPRLIEYLAPKTQPSIANFRVRKKGEWRMRGIYERTRVSVGSHSRFSAAVVTSSSRPGLCAERTAATCCTSGGFDSRVDSIIASFFSHVPVIRHGWQRCP